MLPFKTLRKTFKISLSLFDQLSSVRFNLYGISAQIIA